MIAQAPHQTTSDEQYDRKSINDADSCSTPRAGVHRIYLPLPVDTQAGTEVQTRLSLRLQPHPVGTLHGHAMEVLTGAEDSRREGWDPLHDHLQSFREMVRRWLA